MSYLFQNTDGVEPISDSDGELKANAHLYGVISGCGVTASSSDLTVDGTAGSILHNGSTVAVAGGTDSWTLVPDSSNPRFAWLGYSNAGAAEIVTGDASADPIVPELGDRVADQLVYIPANETLASNCTFIDKRVRTHEPVEKALSLVASSDTPVTTTSTSATDIVSITGLSIPVTSKFIVEIGFSKDATAAVSVLLALTVNATAVKTQFAVSSSTQRAEDGILSFAFGPRTATTPAGALITVFSRVSSNGNAALATDVSQALVAAMPVATVTSLTIRGSNNGSNTNLTVNWYRVWELPL